MTAAPDPVGWLMKDHGWGRGFVITEAVDWRVTAERALAVLHECIVPEAGDRMAANCPPTLILEVEALLERLRAMPRVTS